MPAAAFVTASYFAHPSILVAGPAAHLHPLAVGIPVAIMCVRASNGVSVVVNLATELDSGRDADEPRLVWISARLGHEYEILPGRSIRV